MMVRRAIPGWFAGYLALSSVFADPVIQFAFDSSSAIESSATIPIPVVMSASLPNPVTVHYRVMGGSASPGTDFIAPSGTLTIPAGSRTNSISLTMINNDAPEDAKTVVLAITNVSHGIIGFRQTHTFTILDDDKEKKDSKSNEVVAVRFRSANSSGPESRSPAEIEVHLTRVYSNSVNVSIGLAPGGGATPGADFIFIPTTLIFTPGVTNMFFTPEIIDDARPESNETFTVYLHTPVGMQLVAPTSHTYTIEDDDVPEVSFTSALSSAVESNAVRTLEVRLDRESDLEVRVSVRSSGTATRDADYAFIDTTVVFAPGQTVSNLTYRIIDDDIVEEDETIDFTLFNPLRAVLGTNAVHRHIIIDNDVEQPVIQMRWDVSELGQVVSSGLESESPVDLVFTLSPAPTGQVVLTYSISGTATRDEDYVVDAIPLVFSPSITSRVLRFEIRNDAIVEPQESIIVTITNVTGARLSGENSFTYWIIDDDVPPESIGLFKTSVPAAEADRFLVVLGSKSPTIQARGLALDAGGNYYISDQGAGLGENEGSILMWPVGQERVIRIMRGLTRPEDIELSADGRAIVAAGPLGAISVIPFGVSVRITNLDAAAADSVVYIKSDTGTHHARISPDGWFHIPRILVAGQSSSTVDVVLEVNGKTRIFANLPLGAPGTAGNPQGQTILELSF